MVMAPLRELPRAEARAIRAIFSDVDGTLTTDGALLPSTYRALWNWKDWGGLLVLVTGRPAGWAESFARMWPVDAVVAENGGVTFRRGRRGLERHYAVPRERIAAVRLKMFAAAREVARRVPGAALSMDSAYTEVDLAIDYNEAVHLGHEAADRIEAILIARGFNAVRSSVHVNFWSGRFDKATACRRLARAMKLAPEEIVFIGDSLNDQPMFRGFPISVGVASVRDVLDRLEFPPRFVTRARAGKGFEELVRRLRSGRRASLRRTSQPAPRVSAS